MRSRDTDLGAASTTTLIYDPPDDGDGCRDHQIDVKTAERDGLPADQRTERDPQKRALLFQARIAARLAGNSFASLSCCAGKNSCANSEASPKAQSTNTLRSSARSSSRRLEQIPESPSVIVSFAPSRSAMRPPIRVPAIAPHP